MGHLSERAQRAYMRNVALDALSHYKLDDARVTLINAGFNYSYRIDTAAGEKYALRVNVNSRRSLGNLRAEVSWVEELGTSTSLWVARPQMNRDNEVITFAGLDGDNSFATVLYSWLPGSDLNKAPSPERWYAVGAAMAKLHNHSRDWTLPSAASVPRLDSVTWGAEDRLHGGLVSAPADDLAMLRDTWDQCASVLQRLWGNETGQLIHADLHGWNMKWYRGRLSIFDFDDCGWGLPLQDLTVTSYYIRDTMEFEEALLEGYRSVAALPIFSQDDYEWLVAHRNLMLLNDVVSSVTKEIQQIVPRYTEATVKKIRLFLETGVYRHTLPS
jgi:Ser/Thr protein kinase RdoA (MazF antagonist)